MVIEGQAVHTLHVNEELKAYIDPLQDDELAALEASIVAEGCRHPVIAWDDILIDGHNRYAICHKHGIAFTVESRTFADLDEAKLWMIDNQLARRNVSDYQRGVLALRKKGILAERAKQGQGRRTDLLTNLSKGDAANTRKEIADIAGLSEGTIAKIEKIEAQAVPAVVAAARAKEISINAAAKIAALPADEQRELAAAGVEALREKAAGLGRKPKNEAKTRTVKGYIPEPKPEIISETPAAPAATAGTPAAKAKAKEAVSPEEIDELRERLAEMAHQLQEAHDENVLLHKMTEADDKLAVVVEENRKLRELNRALESQLQVFQDEKNDFIRRIKKFQRRIDQLEREGASRAA